MPHVLAVRATHCLTFNQPQHQCWPNVNVVLSYIQEIWFTKYGVIPCLLDGHIIHLGNSMAKSVNIFENPENHN